MITDRLKNNPNILKYLKILAVLLIIYIGYNLYQWLGTESTDNAYVQSDISNIAAEVSGVVNKVYVQNNEQVKKGQLIAQIDDCSYIANFNKAQGDLEAAHQEINSINQQLDIDQTLLAKNNIALKLTKVNLDLAITDFKRTSDLKKDKFVSQKILDEAQMSLENSQSSFDQAILDIKTTEQTHDLNKIKKSMLEANYKSLEAQLAIASRNLERTKITAPIDGIFSNSSVEVGNYAETGITLFSIVPIDKLYVQANFKETQIRHINKDSKASMTFDAIAGFKIEGSIESFSPATGSTFTLLPPDNATGNFTKIVQRIPIRIAFKIPTKYIDILRPGMSVNVKIRK